MTSYQRRLVFLISDPASLLELPTVAQTRIVMIFSATNATVGRNKIPKTRRVKRNFSKKRKRLVVAVVDEQVLAVANEEEDITECCISVLADEVTIAECVNVLADEVTIASTPIIDVFSSDCILKRRSRATVCACGGLRLHPVCADLVCADIAPDSKLCSFDSETCLSDCVNCIPCTICHRLDADDVEPSLTSAFPEGDAWIFREEDACPRCLAVLLPQHGPSCDVCAFAFESIIL
jgi:hypothetical protein